MATAQEQLDAVNAAIIKIEEGGQKYSLPSGVSVERADLSTLYAQRKRLEQAVSGANFSRRVGIRRSGG